MKTLITIVSTLLAGATPFAASAALRHEAATTISEAEFAVATVPQTEAPTGGDSVEDLRRAVEELRTEKNRLRAEIAAERARAGRERAEALHLSAERQAVAEQERQGAARELVTEEQRVLTEYQRALELHDSDLRTEMEQALLAHSVELRALEVSMATEGADLEVQLRDLEQALQSVDAQQWKGLSSDPRDKHLVLDFGDSGAGVLLVQADEEGSAGTTEHLFGTVSVTGDDSALLLYRQAQANGARDARAAQVRALRSKQSALQHYKPTHSKYALLERKLREVEEQVAALESSQARAEVDEAHRQVIFMVEGELVHLAPPGPGSTSQVQVFGDGEERHVVLTFEDEESRTYIHDPLGGGTQAAPVPAAPPRLHGLFDEEETGAVARAPRPTRAPAPPRAPRPSPSSSQYRDLRWVQVGTAGAGDPEESGVFLDVRPEVKRELHIEDSRATEERSTPTRDELLREVHELTVAMLDELRELRAAVESLSDEVGADRAR